MSEVDKKKLPWALTVVLLFILFLFRYIASYPPLVERFYSGKLFPVFSILGQSITAWIPFSLGDGLYGIGILLLLGLFGKACWLVVKKEFRSALLVFWRMLNGFLVVLLIFYLFWGLNYFRVPLAARLGLSQEPVDSCQLIDATIWCIDRANESRLLLRPEDFKQDNRAIFKRAEDLIMDHPVIHKQLFAFLPTIKHPLWNNVLNYVGVAGYFNPFTQESQVNDGMPIYTRPFTACHELSHQAGIGFEDEANLVGFILCVDSRDPMFEYSAYYQAAFMLLGQVAALDRKTYFSLFHLLNQEVRKDAEREEAYWRQFEGPLNQMSSRFYNEYLQVNNQPEGLKRYSRMTQWLIAWKNSRYTAKKD